MLDDDRFERVRQAVPIAWCAIGVRRGPARLAHSAPRRRRARATCPRHRGQVAETRWTAEAQRDPEGGSTTWPRAVTSAPGRGVEPSFAGADRFAEPGAVGGATTLRTAVAGAALLP